MMPCRQAKFDKASGWLSTVALRKKLAPKPRGGFDA
jgi:hypothetical protein